MFKRVAATFRKFYHLFLVTYKKNLCQKGANNFSKRGKAYMLSVALLIRSWQEQQSEIWTL
jgi:hypothetical protein